MALLTGTTDQHCEVGFYQIESSHVGVCALIVIFPVS